MAKLETIRVKADNEGGYVVINKSDLTNKHTLWTEKKETQKSKKEDKKDATGAVTAGAGGTL